MSSVRTLRRTGVGMRRSGATARFSLPSHRPSAMDSTTPQRGWPHTWVRSGTRGATSHHPMTFFAPRSPYTGSRRRSRHRCATIAKPELMYPETTALKLTRPSGSGNPAQSSTGHSYSGFALLGQSLAPGRPRLRQHAHGVWRLCAPDRSRGRATTLVYRARVQHPALDSLSARRALCPGGGTSGGRRGPDRLLR